MDTEKPPARRPVLLVSSLLAAGVFLIGAALILLFSLRAEDLVAAGPVHLVPATHDYPAPEIELTDLQGNAVQLRDHLGSVVLVNNWATWCPPCKAEMPELQAYYQAHAQDGFVLVAIESGEAAEEVEAFIASLGLTFPIWLDPEGIALDAFNNWSLPSSYVIDQQGSVILSWNGPLTRTTLEKYVTPLLEP